MVELLRRTFEKEGFEVVTTPSGEALLLVSESPPDIVLLDWMLEELFGIEVCRRLRRAIDLPGRTDLIRSVRSAGYALDAEA